VGLDPVKLSDPDPSMLDRLEIEVDFGERGDEDMDLVNEDFLGEDRIGIGAVLDIPIGEAFEGDVVDAKDLL
jgi:hypothetical protein